MPANDFIHSTFSRNPFAMFAPQPVGVSFDNQEKGEKIILLLRAHIITLVPRIFVTIFLIFLPFLVEAFLGFLSMDIGDVLESRQVFLIIFFWYLFVFGNSFLGFIKWYFNIYILTNERIVDIDFKGILHKETAYAKLNQIQDVSPKVIGFFGTFFHFGNIYIQTAAAKAEFEFHNVERPDIVAQAILEEVRKEEAEAPGVIA